MHYGIFCPAPVTAVREVGRVDTAKEEKLIRSTPVLPIMSHWWWMTGQISRLQFSYLVSIFLITLYNYIWSWCCSGAWSMPGHISTLWNYHPTWTPSFPGDDTGCCPVLWDIQIWISHIQAILIYSNLNDLLSRYVCLHPMEKLWE